MNDVRLKLTRPQASLYNHPASLNLYHAGKGVGKSELIGILSHLFITCYPVIKGFIGANTYDQLNTSTMTRVLAVWAKFGYKEWNDQTKTGHFVIHKQPPSHFTDVGHKFINYKNIITFCNGATIFLGSLDNAVAHEGKEFGWACLDETKDSKEEDVKDTILTRLRQRGIFINDKGKYDVVGRDICPMYVFTSPAKVQWLNEWFELDSYRSEIESKIFSKDNYFSRHSERFNIVISSTYHNQENLPSNYIENLIASNPEDKIKMIVYGSPFARSGSEYITSFNEINYIQPCTYDPTKALHLSFDFNIAPYNSCGVYQMDKLIHGYDERLFKKELNDIIKKIIAKYSYCYLVQGIREIALKPPQNSVAKMCDEILSIYSGHHSGMFIYGDATGKNRNIAYQEFKHHYDQIEHKLYKYLSNASMRVLKTNPPNVKRRDYMNIIWEAKTPILIVLDPCMKYTLEDILYCKVDPDGAKEPGKMKDPDTGDTYEKYGHFLDLLEYECFSAFKSYLK